MRKITTIALFIQEISILLDKGNSCSLKDVKKHIEDKDVVDWIEREFSIKNNYVNFNNFEQKHRDYLHEEYEKFLCAYSGDEGRKWGIENNGLCLLVSWGIDIINTIKDHNEWC